MADKSSFYQGIAAGFLAGMAVAAALRYTPFERFIANLSTVEGKLDTKLAALEERLSGASLSAGASPAAAFVSRREQSENAGDPRDLVSTRTAAAAAVEFTRRGGAPGGRNEVEVLESPGRPGALLDHTDVSTPVRPSSRTLDLGSAG